MTGVQTCALPIYNLDCKICDRIRSNCRKAKHCPRLCQSCSFLFLYIDKTCVHIDSTIGIKRQLQFSFCQFFCLIPNIHRNLCYTRQIDPLFALPTCCYIAPVLVCILTEINRDKGWSTGGEFSGTGDKFSPLPTMGTPSGTGMNLSTIYTHGADFFLARIQALEAEGEARMLGRPSVLTVDNVQATLENTSTYYIQVEGYQAVDLFKVEAGTVLRVTPHIIRNERGQTSIKLAVSVQDDQNDSKDAPVSDNSVPPIKQTKINTQAIVGAGQSLLIGGYYYEQKSTDASGIPILMHIPVLGNLFKTTSKGTKRMERLILITPKVIHLDEIPTTPPRVDEPTFHRSPTQADYEERVPAAPQSGCSRKRPELETVTPATAIPLSPPDRKSVV